MKQTRILLSLMLVLVLLSVPAFSAGVKEDGKTVLRVAHFYDSMEVGEMTGYKWFNIVKEGFEQENPDIEIEFEQFQWDEIDIKIMSDFRAGITTHDVTLSTPQLLPQHAAMGTFEDLQPYLDSHWTKEQIEELSWASTYQQGNQGGKQIGIPLGSHSRIALYNKDLFKAANLDPANPPRSIEELITVAKKLTLDTDGDGSIDQWGLGLTLGPDRATIEVTYAPLVWGFGGELYNKVTKKASFAEEAGVKAATLLWDMVNTYKIVNPASMVNSYNRNVFDAVLEERVAIAFGWGSYWVNALEDNGFVQGIFPATADGVMTKIAVFPYPTVGGSGFTNSWDVSMYSKSENKEAAWKFIDYLVTKADLKTYTDAGLPIRKSEWEKPEYQTPYFETFYEAIADGRPMPESAQYNELADLVSSALQRCMAADRAEIPSILLDAQNDFNAKYQGQ